YVSTDDAYTQAARASISCNIGALAAQRGHGPFQPLAQHRQQRRHRHCAGASDPQSAADARQPRGAHPSLQPGRAGPGTRPCAGRDGGPIRTGWPPQRAGRHGGLSGRLSVHVLPDAAAVAAAGADEENERRPRRRTECADRPRHAWDSARPFALSGASARARRDIENSVLQNDRAASISSVPSRPVPCAARRGRRAGEGELSTIMLTAWAHYGIVRAANAYRRTGVHRSHRDPSPADHGTPRETTLVEAFSYWCSASPVGDLLVRSARLYPERAALVFP